MVRSGCLSSAWLFGRPLCPVGRHFVERQPQYPQLLPLRFDAKRNLVTGRQPVHLIGGDAAKGAQGFFPCPLDVRELSAGIVRQLVPVMKEVKEKAHSLPRHLLPKEVLVVELADTRKPLPIKDAHLSSGPTNHALSAKFLQGPIGVYSRDAEHIRQFELRNR